MNVPASPALLCLGLSHRTASVARREAAAFGGEAQDHAFQKVRDGQIPGIDQLVILSTCNRTELYTACCPSEGTLAEGWKALAGLFTEHTRLTPEALRDSAYWLHGAKAVRHLFRVAAGLDSLVMGETQILGQLARAYERARTGHVTGALLSVLMQHAIRAGKRVHAEAPLQAVTRSISAVAVCQAQKALTDLQGKNALVIGAGRMAQLAASALAHHHLAQIVICNRSPEAGQRLALQCGGVYAGWEHLEMALAQADAVIAAVSVAEPVITPARLRETESRRVILDLGLPRNVDRAVTALSGVTLYDLDDLRSTADRMATHYADALPQAESLLGEAVQAFERHWAERAAIPAIMALFHHAEAVPITQARLHLAIQHLKAEARGAYFPDDAQDQL